jgi:uncharacterized protein
MTNGVIWYELLTTEPEAAATFYGNVLGWRAAAAGQPGMDYHIVSMNGVAVGGVMAIRCWQVWPASYVAELRLRAQR